MRCVERKRIGIACERENECPALRRSLSGFPCFYRMGEFLQRFRMVQPVAEGGGAPHPADEIRRARTRFPHAPRFPLLPHNVRDKSDHKPLHLVERRARVLRLLRIFQPPEQPRISQRGPSDRHLPASAVEVHLHIRARRDIPVPDERHARVPDRLHGPRRGGRIGGGRVHLLARPAVQRDLLRPGLRHAPCERGGDLRIPPEAEFDRRGNAVTLADLPHRRHDPRGAVRIEHEGGTLSVRDDLSDGTAHVDVDPGGRRGIGTAPVIAGEEHFGGARHDLRLVTEDLQDDGRLAGGDLRELGGLAVVPRERHGGDHLADRVIRAEGPADPPERRVREPRHGGEGVLDGVVWHEVDYELRIKNEE